MTTNAVANFIHLNHKLLDLNAFYNWTLITTSDDPRIKASNEANDALAALTDAEIDEVERITGWTL